LTGQSRLEEDVVMRKLDSSTTIVSLNSMTSSGSSQPLGRLVASMAKRALHGDVLARVTQQAADGGGPVSLASRVAAEYSSVNDELRAEAERERLDASARKLLEVDRALTALRGVHERPARAVHCRTCQKYFYRKPADCVARGHTVAAVDTVQRYFECDHCRHKITVLGDVVPAMVHPACPKCRHTAIWNKSSAAPDHCPTSSSAHHRGDDERTDDR
jgi:hypothetical protein